MAITTSGPAHRGLNPDRTNDLEEEIKHLFKRERTFTLLYLSTEATSARVAILLQEKGFNTFVIVGGLAAWRKAEGHSNRFRRMICVKLPTFS